METISHYDSHHSALSRQISSQSVRPYRTKSDKDADALNKTMSRHTKTQEAAPAAGEKHDDGDAFSSASTDDSLTAAEWRYLTWDTAFLGDHGPPARGGEDLPPPDLSSFANPMTWSAGRKSALIWLSCIATVFTAYSPGSYSPAIPQMQAYFEISRLALNAGITVFTTGFAIAPMVLAPFSEINGRRPIFLTTGTLFFVFILLSAVTHLYSGMIIVRLLAGCMGSTFSTMVGDIYDTHERNTPMTIFTFGAIFGTGLGPFISGFIAQNVDWRWVFYVHAIVMAVLAGFLLVLFKETRGSVLLGRKAAALNKWYEEREARGHHDHVQSEHADTKPSRVRWKVKADEERGPLLQMIRISIVRPIYMLFTEPVVFFFSLWMTFAWCILYSMFAGIVYTYQTVYSFDLQEACAVFAAVMVGAILSTGVSLLGERLRARYLSKDKQEAPESRLYSVCFEGALLPIGLFWFGWTSNPHVHWAVSAVGIGAATMGIFSIYLAITIYLANVYGPYASSAIAAQSCCRNFTAGFFPLFTSQMYHNLGFGPAASMMGGIGIALTLIPWVLVYFGPAIRKRSPFASEIMAAAQESKAAAHKAGPEELATEKAEA